MTDLPGDAVLNPAGYFPGSFLNIFQQLIERHLPNHAVLLRPARNTDPVAAVGIYAASWVPDTDSFQIGQYEPAINHYLIKLQNIQKSFDEEMGRAVFTAAAKVIRVILYRDPDLRVQLLGLQEEILRSVERVTKYNVLRQDFLSSKLGATFFYLATTDIMIETESTAL